MRHFVGELHSGFVCDFFYHVILYQKVVSKIDPTLFFVLNFHEQTAIFFCFRTIIELAVKLIFWIFFMC